MARWRSARAALVACIVMAALLVLADARGTALPSALRAVAAVLAGPPERALGAVRDSVSRRLSGSAAEGARIAELEAELAEVRRSAGLAALGRLTAEELRELAALAPPAGYDRAPARVVAMSAPQDLVLSAAIAADDAGIGDGSLAREIRTGQAVVTAEGLAGIVDSVAAGVATVRLVGDRGTALAARVAGTGEVGVYSGAGGDGVLELLDPMGGMEVGDLVVSLGFPAPAAGGGPARSFPSGVPIGRIARIEGRVADLTRRAVVAPLVKASTLDRVAVLVPERRP